MNLVLALATGELVHNILEISNVRNKIRRLKAYIANEPYTEMKLHIDTRAKSYALSVMGFVIFTALFYGVFSAFTLSGNNFLTYLVAVLTLAYFVTAVMLDKYHVEVERVTRPFMKKKG